MAIGSAEFDYSSVLSGEPDFVPQLGQFVEVEGLQPLPGGRIVVGIHDTGEVGDLHAISPQEILLNGRR
jgi:hypothetical protein